jgi:SAM-dependent methyltransferase
MADGTAEAQRDLYERDYSTHDEKNQRWKALCAAGNVGPIEHLLARAAVSPQSVIEVGCGDGSVMAAMSSRGLGSSFVGYEIAPSAVSFAAGRSIPGLERVELFDGESIPEPDDSFDLGMLHFVIDQVPSPGALLAEVRRIARYVLVAVVLDDTRRSRAKLRRDHGGRFGSTQLYNRSSIRQQIECAGLEILAEHIRAPGHAESVYWAAGPVAKSRAYALAAARAGISWVAPRYAEGLFGHSYRALARRA